MQNTEVVKYITYNGLNRPAMVMGVPLMLLLGMGFLGVFGTAILMSAFGVNAFIFTAIILLVTFAIKLTCENDPNALSVLKMNLNGVLLSLRQNIGTLGKETIVAFDSTGVM
ncbi:MAG: VirB3 family type IV secretion system protein [Aeromonas sp.]